MSYVFQMTQNAGLSEDLTHEVFLRAWRTRDTFRGQSKYSTWLWTIARNSTIDHFRKNSTKLETNDSIDVESPATSAESALIEQCDRLAVEGCMQKLTTDQREALSLRTLADLSYDEIAVAMQTSLPAVKSLINRAKRSLIECLRTNDRGAP